MSCSSPTFASSLISWGSASFDASGLITLSSEVLQDCIASGGIGWIDGGGGYKLQHVRCEVEIQRSPMHTDTPEEDGPHDVLYVPLHVTGGGKGSGMGLGRPARVKFLQCAYIKGEKISTPSAFPTSDCVMVNEHGVAVACLSSDSAASGDEEAGATRCGLGKSVTFLCANMTSQ